MHGRGFWNGGDDTDLSRAVGEHHDLAVAFARPKDSHSDGIYDPDHIWSQVVGRRDVLVAYTGREMEMGIVHVITHASMLAGHGKQMLGNDKIKWEFVRPACLCDTRLWVVGLWDGHCELQEGMSCVNASAVCYGCHILDVRDSEAMESNFHFVESSGMWCSYRDLARQAVARGVRYRPVVVLIQPDVHFWMAIMGDLPCDGRHSVG